MGGSTPLHLGPRHCRKAHGPAAVVLRAERTAGPTLPLPSRIGQQPRSSRCLSVFLSSTCPGNVDWPPTSQMGRQRLMEAKSPAGGHRAPHPIAAPSLHAASPQRAGSGQGWGAKGPCPPGVTSFSASAGRDGEGHQSHDLGCPTTPGLASECHVLVCLRHMSSNFCFPSLKGGHECACPPPPGLP